MKNTILVVDDEYSIREALKSFLTSAGYAVKTADSVESAKALIKSEIFDIVISDQNLNDGRGIALLEELKTVSPETPFLIMTAYGSVKDAVDAIRQGAFDYIEKSQNLYDWIEHRVKRALELRSITAELESRRDSRHHEILVGSSQKIKELRAILDKASQSDSTVLICGESGSGKEIAARYIHINNKREKHPFIAVNCAALSAGILESELFGHEKGAFTGAIDQRKGRFELANNGTILLDEISEIEPRLQAKLLRVLQERSFERVGSSVTRFVDVRVIATTNRNIEKEVREGRFREDLYFRLNVIRIDIPPLRDHKEDIIELVRHFLGQIPAGRQKKFSEKALQLLHQYSWPGNVRELRNVVERAVALCPGDTIDAELIRPWLVSTADSVPLSEAQAVEFLVGKMTIEQVTSKMIELALSKYKSQEDAARVLGISSRTLRNRAGSRDKKK